MIAPLSKPAVDCHFHVFAAGVAQPGARYVPAYSASFDSWRRAARASGIARGVLVQTSFMGFDNLPLITLLRAHPQDLRAVVVVPPMISLGELFAMKQLGVRGVRMNLVGGLHDLSALGYALPFWELLRSTAMHLELHTDRGRVPDLVKQIPSDIPLVIDHLGKPETLSRNDPTVRSIVDRSQQTTVHVKLSGAYRLGGLNAPELTHLWLSELGFHRLVWGSDWPHTNYETCGEYSAHVSELDDWLNHDEATLNAVRVTNPQTLYWD